MSRKKFLCLDCKVDTGKIHEHYWIKPEVWYSVVNSNRGMLCIGCIEVRLKRRLRAEDFPLVTINSAKYEPKSKRLMERIGSVA